MPIYKANEMKETPDVKRPHISMIQYGGDLIKAGLVTYYEGDAPPPHYHPNDEQWIYLLEGSLAVLMGDDVEPRRDFIDKNALSVKELDI